MVPPRLTVRDGAFNHKIDYFKKLKEILNLKGHPNRITGYPRGAAPRESLITQGTSCRQIFKTIPKDFPQFFTLKAIKNTRR